MQKSSLPLRDVQFKTLDTMYTFSNISQRTTKGKSVGKRVEVMELRATQQANATEIYNRLTKTKQKRGCWRTPFGQFRRLKWQPNPASETMDEKKVVLSRSQGNQCALPEH